MGRLPELKKQEQEAHGRQARDDVLAGRLHADGDDHGGEPDHHQHGYEHERDRGEQTFVEPQTHRHADDRDRNRPDQRAVNVTPCSAWLSPNCLVTESTSIA
jgi:hypothetical protein